MKRIFTYISMLILAVACNDELYGPEETPLTPDTAASVEITVTEVKDSSFTVTVTPAGEAAYYSWLVDEAAVAEELDAEALYAVDYEGVTQGTVKWTAEATSKTFTVKGLSPNTTYQIYAVAGSKMGVVGAVAVKDVKTTDVVAPGYADVDTEANQVLFTFTEAVQKGEKVGGIKVAYYASYSAEFKATAAPAGEVTVPADSVLVADNQALISVPDLPTGCYWTISIPEGAFVDAVGQPLPAYASAFVMTEEGPAPKGFYGEVEYVELPMLGELDVETFSDWTAPFVIPVDSEYAYAALSTKKFISVTYESPNKVVELTLTPGTHYGVVSSLGALVVYLPEQPEFGADVTINVPAGALYDVYGNDCEAWEATALHSYGYTLEDIVGSYLYTATSAYTGEDVAGVVVIAESDDAKKGNVMFTTMYSTECTWNIYATFDFDGGVLTVPSQQLYYKGSQYNFAFGSSTNTGAISTDDVVFTVPESGVLVGPDSLFGDFAVDPATNKVLGFYDLFYNFTAEFGEPAPAAPAAVASKVLRASSL